MAETFSSSLSDVLGLCSNGLGHQADETEFDEGAGRSTPPAAEPAESRETFEEPPVPLGDDSYEQVGSTGDTAKPAEDDGSVVAVAEQEPATADQSQQDATPDQERPVETEELEQEVEGKLSWYSVVIVHENLCTCTSRS